MAIVVVQLSIISIASFAQEQETKPISEENFQKSKSESKPNSEEIALPSPLEKLRFQLLQVTKMNELNREELKDLQKKAPTREITGRIEQLQNEIEDLNKNFETLATQLHATEIPAQQNKEMGWLEELQEITRPLLNALREITQRPRRIDNLKARIESIQSQILSYQGARENLESLLKLNGKYPEITNDEKNNRVNSKQIIDNYNENLQRLADKYNPELLQLELEETKRSLNELQTDGTTVLSVVSESIGDFLKERGNHFLLAVSTFFGLLWFLSFLYKTIQDRTKMFSKFNRSARKIVKTVYNLLIFAVSALISLLVLYLLNDWLLLSFIVMFLIALGWTSRQLIPKFLQELRLILNFGTVREGERMFWKGVPWLVKEIGVNAILMNPRLQGGVINLPVGELIGHHSRPFVKEEEWFPTDTGDWVILSDDTYGKVLSQTPEQVILENLGSRKYYLSPEFLTLKPKNLSSGFTLRIKFGLDYGVQSRICHELPDLFLSGLEKNTQDLQDSKPPVFDFLKVQFADPGASSLNLVVIAGVNGAYGDDYYSLQRKINTIMVQICNENDLVIPFNQMTLSLSSETMDIVKKV